MNVLVAAPHPDDDVIGCGGALILHARAGHAATVVYLTCGEAGGIGPEAGRLAAIREGEARRAARQLGAAELIFLGQPDGYLTAGRDTIAPFVGIVRRVRPYVLYVPHATDAHPDHRVAHAIAVEAARRAAGPWFPDAPGEPWSIPTILCYEIWTPLPAVSLVIDVTAVMPAKLAALRRHRSQLRDIAYDEAVAALNRFRGITTGQGRYCECFQVLAAGAEQLLGGGISPAS